jgi:Holliday junction resolvase RusA-like endonuclease
MQAEIEREVCFTVPYLIPVSGNHYKRPCKYIGRDGSLHLGFKTTKEAKAYYDATAIFARGRTVAPQTDSERRKVRYGVRIDVYLPPKARGDFDNFWKCGLDALVHCGLIHSDAAVDGDNSKCVVHRDQRTNPRTEYLVTRLEALNG